MPIGAQAVAQHVSVAPVILGAGHGEAVAEPIELLGIDPIDAETAFQQGFDDGALRHFDGHPDYLGRGAGAGNQPIAQLLDPRAAMRNGSFPQALSMGIDQANLMGLARPVDAPKPFNLFRHAQALSRITHIRAAATSVNPCTGARSATSHGTSVAADLPGCRSAPGAQNTGIRGRLPAGQPGPASLQCRPANNRFKGYRDSLIRAEISLIADLNSLQGRKKFPVRVRRELARKALV